MDYLADSCAKLCEGRQDGYMVWQGVPVYICPWEKCELVVPVPISQMVERPLREREVVGSNPGRAIPKALKMVPVATLLGAQHYYGSTGSHLTHY